MKKAQYWIKHLKLKTHPEGGYYAEVYKSGKKILLGAKASPNPEDRALATHIYFLVDKPGFSAFHKLDADELWHFYEGNRLTLHLLHEEGKYEKILLGPDVLAGEQFYALVPAGIWFAAEVDGTDDYALVGCTMAPGFEFSGFDLAYEANLIRQYPEHATLISRLTRQ